MKYSKTNSGAKGVAENHSFVYYYHKVRGLHSDVEAV